MAQRSAAELVKQELKLGRMIASNLILIINASLLSSSLPLFFNLCVFDLGAERSFA